MAFFSEKIAKAKWQLRYLGNSLRGAAGLNREIFKNAGGGVRIITYHGICLDNPLRFNASFITAKAFEKHLQFYRKHFNLISLDDYLAGNISRDRFNVCLTFDDGHRNNLKYALPLLEKYQAPATFFITGIREAGYDILWNDFLAVFSRSGPKRIIYKDQPFHKNRWNRYIAFADGHSLQDQIRDGGFSLKSEMMELLDPQRNFRQKNAAYEDYWLQMTSEEITTLSRSRYVKIGGHSLYHNDLTRIPKESVAADFIACKNFLENTIQKEVNTFAFPYGSYEPSVTEAGLAAGFSHFFAVDYLFGEKDNVLISERFVVNPYISTTNQMLAIISGRY
jgi:peptidoglycan/xylan/chitin deacetylase (PgdA/CDA1 family)